MIIGIISLFYLIVPVFLHKVALMRQGDRTMPQLELRNTAIHSNVLF